MSFGLIKRLSTALFVLCLITFVGCGGPSIQGPYTIQHANELEKAGKVQDALSIYTMIVRENQRSNPDIAANALYEGGKFASDPVRYGKTEDLRNQGQDMAVQMWKQLRDDFPSKASSLLLIGLPGDKFVDLANQITLRNSSQVGFKVIDSFVTLTGKNPSFSYALALILIAIVVRVILFPITKKQYAAQREMQRMQPLIKELQAKYKGREAESRVEMNEKMMALYKEHNVNPFASCMPSLIQLPFLIMVFGAIRQYEFAFSAGKFLWIGSPLARQFPGIIAANLASPDVPLLVIYVLSNYITMRMTPATDPQQQQQQSSMALITSVLFFWMFLTNRWSSAFILYWFTTNLIMIWQQYHFIYKPAKLNLANSASTSGVIDTKASEVKPSTENLKTASANQKSKVDPSKAALTPEPPRARPRKKK